MSKLMLVAALVWPLTGTLAFHGTHAVADVGSGAQVQLAMGPDPGGHTGDGVTPTTTRTGQPVDNGSAPKSETAPKSTKDEPAKQPAQGTSAPSGTTSGQTDQRR